MWTREVNVTFGVTPELLNILERVCIIIERIQLQEDTILEEIQKINRRLTKMATQADIDALTASVQASTAAIVTKIEEETQEVKDFIAANPSIDTSALSNAVAGLESIAADVDNILPDAPAEPPVEPPVEP